MERLTERNSKGQAFQMHSDFQVLVDRLADYEEKEEQGRLLELPFSIGAKIYKVEYTVFLGRILKTYVSEGVFTLKFYVENRKHIDKLIFGTFEEAEIGALKLKKKGIGYIMD